MPVISLLLHITFPWRWAVRLSLALLALVALPATWLAVSGSHTAGGEAMRSLLINGVLMQLTFLVSLVSVDRLKHGVGLIVAGDHDGPADAHAALASWLKGHTDELARARDAAEEASRAKSRFLAVMSHELRTPLHAMMVSADLMSDKGSLPDDAAREARLLHTIQSSGQHLLSLIDQVLELSRIEAGKVEAQEQPLDIGHVVQKACASVKPMADLKGLKLLIGLPDDLPRLRMGDELRLTQVLINLLANSTKFTTQGHIGLTLKRMPDAPAGEDWLRLSVVDTGQGMSESEQTRVFDAFYQVDGQSTRQHGGVGLGLTITQELVALMKGRLSLRSKPGHGTRIDVDLPLPVLQDAQASSPTQRKTSQQLLRQVVLVVDDDEVNRMLVTEVLQGAGAIVHTEENGASALAYLRDHCPAVVLMDWRMPGMDGLETTRRLRQGEAGDLSRDVPVIGLTANAFEEDRDACLSCGMNNVLTKPVDRQQLLDELAHWVDVNPSQEHAHPQRRTAG
jgi:signal transduction histidine kinase/CheY-like chemotaxis protein